MLQVASLLLLALAAGPAEGKQDTLALTAELKDVPAQGKDGPRFQLEGTTNLGNGAVLVAYLYYEKIDTGREIYKDTPLVKNGKFSQDFPVFRTRTFPGTYFARVIYEPNLQNLGGADFPRGVFDFKLQIGDGKDVDREGKGVRDLLVAEIRALLAVADEMKAKFDEMKSKTPADRDEQLRVWRERASQIRERANPRKNPELYLLRLDVIADAGFEDQINLLMACGRAFVLQQRESMNEGFTRLKQACDVYIGDIAYPRLTDFTQMAGSVDECRALLRKLIDNPDQPVLPVRRRFIELTALLDKSVPVDYREVILGAISRGAALFNAVSDKTPDARQLHADLDGLLERFAATLRGNK